eukprot:TRINITY_DN61423_c0_g1_i1.p1 TRINITY_DN61423_c0_g1~~TRINITY_DN61423_c0_g1_i1.p1  ORF type:complete len:770 (-),score=79.20 TRINITY_DN61423_c0_g1_i1:300-2609(-)
MAAPSPWPCARTQSAIRAEAAIAMAIARRTVRHAPSTVTAEHGAFRRSRQPSPSPPCTPRRDCGRPRSAGRHCSPRPPTWPVSSNVISAVEGGGGRSCSSCVTTTISASTQQESIPSLQTRLIGPQDNDDKSQDDVFALPPAVVSALLEFADCLQQRLLTLMGFGHPHLERFFAMLDQQLGSLGKMLRTSFGSCRALLGWQAAARNANLWRQYRDGRQQLLSCKHNLTRIEAAHDDLVLGSFSDRRRRERAIAAIGRLLVSIVRASLLRRCLTSWKCQLDALKLSCQFAFSRGADIAVARTTIEMHRCFSSWSVMVLRERQRQTEEQATMRVAQASTSNWASRAACCLERRMIADAAITCRMRFWSAWARLACDTRCIRLAEAEANACHAAQRAIDIARRSRWRSLANALRWRSRESFRVWAALTGHSRHSRELQAMSEVHSQAESALLSRSASVQIHAQAQLRRSRGRDGFAMLIRCLYRWVIYMSQLRGASAELSVRRCRSQAVEALRARACRQLSHWTMTTCTAAESTIASVCVLAWRYDVLDERLRRLVSEMGLGCRRATVKVAGTQSRMAVSPQVSQTAAAPTSSAASGACGGNLSYPSPSSPLQALSFGKREACCYSRDVATEIKDIGTEQKNVATCADTGSASTHESHMLLPSTGITSSSCAAPLLTSSAVSHSSCDIRSSPSPALVCDERAWRREIERRKSCERAARRGEPPPVGAVPLSDSALLHLASQASASEAGYQELLEYHRQQRRTRRSSVSTGVS